MFNEDPALKQEAAGKQKKLPFSTLFLRSLMRRRRRRRRLEPKRTTITHMAAVGNYHLAKKATMLTLSRMQEP